MWTDIEIKASSWQTLTAVPTISGRFDGLIVSKGFGAGAQIVTKGLGGLFIDATLWIDEWTRLQRESTIWQR